MWTAKLVDKQLKNGVLSVNVEFTDDTDSFNEIFDITGGNADTLGIRVDSRIKTLETTEVLHSSLQLGPIERIEPQVDEKLEAISKLSKLKQLVTLGVIEASDKEVTEAIQDVKDAL